MGQCHRWHRSWAARLRSVQLYGITCPLLTKSDGAKMGKTEGGAVWLSPERTSPYKFYQYWINVDDADAGKCLRFLTELPHEEIDALDAARATDPGKRDSQRRLAEAASRSWSTARAAWHRLNGRPPFSLAAEITRTV